MAANRPLAMGLRRSRRAIWCRLLALVVAAVVPVAEAFCAVGLPAAVASTPTVAIDAPGRSSSDEHRSDRCCERLPSALAASDHPADDLATGPAGALEPPLAPAASLLQPSPRATAGTTIRFDVPPPAQPLFRRLKRLLI